MPIMTTPHVEYLAHHWIVLAVPAFLPAVIVVGVVTMMLVMVAYTFTGLYLLFGG